MRELLGAFSIGVFGNLKALDNTLTEISREWNSQRISLDDALDLSLVNLN